MLRIVRRAAWATVAPLVLLVGLRLSAPELVELVAVLLLLLALLVAGVLELDERRRRSAEQRRRGRA